MSIYDAIFLFIAHFIPPEKKKAFDNNYLFRTATTAERYFRVKKCYGSSRRFFLPKFGILEWLLRKFKLQGRI